MDTKCENIGDKAREFNKWILMIKFDLRPILKTFNGSKWYKKMSKIRAGALERKRGSGGA